MSCNKRDIRPHLKHITNTEYKRPEEKFQNITLRPILKMQHEILIAAFLHYVAKNKINFTELNKPKKDALIAQIFKTNHVFKTEVRGLIIGHFTVNEYQEYLEMHREINRRIITMSAQRIQSAF